MKTGEIADDFQRAKGGFSPFSKLRAISAFLHIPVCRSFPLFICLAISLSASFPSPPFHCHFPLGASGSESLSLFSWLLFSSGTGKLPSSFRLFLFRLPLFLCSLPYSHCHKLYYFRLVFIAFCLTTIRYVYQNACWKNRLQQFPTVGVFCQNCRVGFATFISILVSMISALKLFTCLSILSSLIQTRRTHFLLSLISSNRLCYYAVCVAETQSNSQLYLPNCSRSADFVQRRRRVDCSPSSHNSSGRGVQIRSLKGTNLVSEPTQLTKRTDQVKSIQFDLAFRSCIPTFTVKLLELYKLQFQNIILFRSSHALEMSAHMKNRK